MKKHSNILKVMGLLAMMAILLSACAAHTTSGALQPPSSGPYAWIYSIFGKPLQNIMIWFSQRIGGANGAGWAISIITLVVQFIVMPLRLVSQRKMTTQQEKMRKLQPQMQLVQDALKKPGLTQDQQMQISQLQMKVYRENNLSMTGGMGCLPLLIQLPIMAGIYQAVAYSSTLANSTFFGISLSQRSIIFSVIATVLYLIQGWLSMIGLPEEQKKTMRMTIFLSPAITFFISISYSGALALYFMAGGVVIVIQQLITTFIIMPKVKKDVEKELNERPLKQVVTPALIDDILGNSTTASSPAAQEKKQLHQDLRQRNAGKQRRPNNKK